MNKETKEYIFNNTVTITEETTIEANSYAEAVELFLAGGGDTEEISCNGDNWDCILNADDFEDDKENEDVWRFRFWIWVNRAVKKILW